MTIPTDTLSQLAGLQPIAPAVGPFPLLSFVDAVTRFRGEAVEVVGDDRGALPLTISDETVTVAGHPDLTDYHSPLGENVSAIADDLIDLAARGFRLDLDSLPEEACGPLATALVERGLVVEIEEHTVSAVVALPASFDEYLGMLSKKQRHEVRRKHRRYEDLLGEVIHEVHNDPGWAFGEFIRLHRLSEGEKGGFMTPARQSFFEALVELDGWRVDVLRIADTDRVAAALFSYSDDSAIYLYNSAYDPSLSDASPGIAIVGTLIEQAISEGLPRFDFLKGDETYKFRLGAEARPLYRITGGGT
ncbi:MAG TPA: GNAT family N-acetyltransferase [Acidimicrobiia bacterium]|jgi:CelD/BcsL family acetyltransferase involved in cellulose biosynthesis